MTSPHIGVVTLPTGGVSRTSFITLYCHAIDARSEKPILNDVKSLEIAAEIDRIRAGSKKDHALDLPRKISHPLVPYIATRARQYDRYVREFLARFPGGVVINIGCGLDSRFVRIDNGSVQYYDLDLPAIMAFRSRFFSDTARCHAFASSVLEYSWMDAIAGQGGPFLFLAEGVFMYLSEDEVKGLVLELKRRFPGSELVCEVVNKKWLTGLHKIILDLKMEWQLHLPGDVTYRSGLSHSREMEEWEPGISFLDEWSYFDSCEGNQSFLKLFRHVEFIRYIQWTVHYRLG